MKTSAIPNNQICSFVRHDLSMSLLYFYSVFFSLKLIIIIYVSPFKTSIWLQVFPLHQYFFYNCFALTAVNRLYADAFVLSFKKLFVSFQTILIYLIDSFRMLHTVLIHAWYLGRFYSCFKVEGFISVLIDYFINLTIILQCVCTIITIITE